MRSLLRIRSNPDLQHHRSGLSSSGPLNGTAACSVPSPPTAASAAAAAAAAPAMNHHRVACSSSPAMRTAHPRPDKPLPQYKTQATATWLSSPTPPDDSASSIADALDWQPRLPLTSTLVCLAAASAATTAAAFLLSPPSRTLTLRYAAALALTFLAALSFTRTLLLERLYLARARSETDLGDPNSSFATLCGVSTHFKTSLNGRAIPDPNRRSAKDRLAPPPAPPSGSETTATTTAVHCYHGFGANLYSYEPVHRRLSGDLSALVTAHDMPGFGLTSRPPAGPCYHLAFNAQLGRQVQDHELSRLGLQPKHKSSPASLTSERSLSSASSSSMSSASSMSGQMQDLDSPSNPAPPAAVGQQGVVAGTDGPDGAAASGAAAGAGASPPVPGGRVRRVLIGHSMGAICAALQAVEDPDVAALILVAPAILVLPGASKAPLQPLTPLPDLTAPGAEFVQRFTPSTPPSSPPALAPPAASRPRHVLLQLAARVGSTLRVALLLCVLLLLRALRPLLFLLLRAAVRSRNFWVQGLGQAFHDKTKLTDKALNDYRLPQLVRGWEAGMCQFLEARLAPVQLSDLWAPWRAAESEPGPEDENLVGRLAEAIRRRNAAAGSGAPPLRVLLVHGRGDALVPATNSERLARLLPGSGGVELAVLERCGHMPHEEWPELFSQLVTEFVSRT